MSPLLLRVSAPLIAVVSLAAAAPAPEPLSRAEVAKLAKPATALVEVKPSGYGSSFCIHPSGLFVTNEHVVSSVGAQGTVTLVLNPGLKSQRTLKAKVVRLDKDMDLALLQAEGDHKLAALSLGSDEELAELTELIAFGFPFGTALAKAGQYPSVSVNVVNVSSLRTDAKRELHRIQLDSNLNPGNSGGPVVDRYGRVAGVVVSAIRGAGINLAIPVRHLRKFLDRPVIAFTPPVVRPKNQHEPAEFRATATALPGDPAALELELFLGAPGGGERRFPMKGANGKYVVKAIPFPVPEREPTVRVEIKYLDGSIAAAAKDRAFRVGTQALKLSEVRRLQPGAKAEVLLADGKKLEGPLADLDALAVQVGGQSLDLRLAEAVEVKIIPPLDQNRVRCTVVVRKGGKEVGRHAEYVYLEGARRATLESVRDGKFIKPLPAANPTTYLKSVSSPGDFIGQGKTYSYEGNALKVGGTAALITIHVDGWNIQFAPPRGGALKVGEYPDAKRYPFHDKSPGLSYSGHGRASNRVGGKFVIWELEVANGRVARLAVDFIHRSEETGPPLYGMIRYNSTLE